MATFYYTSRVIKGMDEGERLSRAAYEYFIDEVKREDGIVISRLTAALALQGILFASLAFIVSSGVPADVTDRDTIIAIRRMFQLVIMLAGLFSSLLAWRALIASRDALDQIRLIRANTLNDPSNEINHLAMFPGNKTEGNITFQWASKFPHGSMIFFLIIWTTVFLIYVLVVLGGNKVWPFWPKEAAAVEKIDHVLLKDGDRIVEVTTGPTGRLVNVKTERMPGANLEGGIPSSAALIDPQLNSEIRKERVFPRRSTITHKHHGRLDVPH